MYSKQRFQTKSVGAVQARDNTHIWVWTLPHSGKLRKGWPSACSARTQYLCNYKENYAAHSWWCQWAWPYRHVLCSLWVSCASEMQNWSHGTIVNSRYLNGKTRGNHFKNWEHTNEWNTDRIVTITFFQVCSSKCPSSGIPTVAWLESNYWCTTTPSRANAHWNTATPKCTQAEKYVCSINTGIFKFFNLILYKKEKKVMEKNSY